MIISDTFAAHLTGDTDATISVNGGSISLDAGRAPHVEATLDTNYAGAALTDLDPRETPRVTILVSAVYPWGTIDRTFDLGARSRPVEQLDGRVSLSLASDEALLQDYAPLADVNLTAHAASGRALVNAVLDTVIPGAELEPGDDFTISVSAADDLLIWRAGDDALGFLAPILQAAGLRLVCDELRRWTLRDESYKAAGVINTRYGINLHDASDTIDRDTGLWFDAAVTRHRWTDPAGEQHEAVDAYALTTPYTRLMLFEKTTPYPGPGFSEYAVRRAQGRGREVTATMLADWRANAEQRVIAVLDGAPIQTGVTQSVEFDITAGQMTFTTRSTDTPPSAWVLLPEGESWADSPVGESWTEEAI